MDLDAVQEARGIVASARELLAELADEGVDQIEGLSEAVAALAAASQSAAVAARPAADARVESDAESHASPTPLRSEAAVAAPGSTPPALLDSTALTWGQHTTLEEVRERLGECQRCGLCEGRKNIVFGQGNPDAALMFIGEGPGEQEDLQGLPFVGRAGELLTQMIEKGMGIPRSEVYICNIVKCRPPRNRTPLANEVSACRPFLDGQIQAVRPKVIVSLGKPAASLLLDREVAITRVRGSWQEYRGIPLMPTLHPAFILRQYTPENRRLVWEDLKAALARSRE